MCRTAKDRIYLFGGSFALSPSYNGSNRILRSNFLNNTMDIDPAIVTTLTQSHPTTTFASETTSTDITESTIVNYNNTYNYSTIEKTTDSMMGKTTDSFESFTISQSLVTQFNSTMQQHNATNLENNFILQNSIIAILKEKSDDRIQYTNNDVIEITISQIWAYSGSYSFGDYDSNNNCKLQYMDEDYNKQDSDDSGLIYSSWIQFNVTFSSYDKQNEWQSKFEGIFDAFSNQLSKLNYFVNDTISIAYCSFTDVQRIETSKNVNNLDFSTIILPICIMGVFILIAICGYIDANVIRRNEIFSIVSIMTAATFTVDIVSGLYYAYILKQH